MTNLLSLAADDYDALTAVATSFSECWNRHDMSAFAMLFAANADFVNVVGMWWKGRTEIEAAHAHSHATFFKQSQLSGDVQAVKVIGPGVATVHVLWELSGQVEPSGDVGKPRHGMLLLVMVQNDGRWLIQTAQNTDIVAGVATIAAAKP